MISAASAVKVDGATDAEACLQEIEAFMPELADWMTEARLNGVWHEHLPAELVNVQLEPDERLALLALVDDMHIALRQRVYAAQLHPHELRRWRLFCVFCTRLSRLHTLAAAVGDPDGAPDVDARGVRHAVWCTLAVGSPLPLPLPEAFDAGAKTTRSHDAMRERTLEQLDGLAAQLRDGGGFDERTRAALAELWAHSLFEQIALPMGAWIEREQPELVRTLMPNAVRMYSEPPADERTKLPFGADNAGSAFRYLPALREGIAPPATTYDVLARRECLRALHSLPPARADDDMNMPGVLVSAALHDVLMPGSGWGRVVLNEPKLLRSLVDAMYVPPERAPQLLIAEPLEGYFEAGAAAGAGVRYLLEDTKFWAAVEETLRQKSSELRAMLQRAADKRRFSASIKEAEEQMSPVNALSDDYLQRHAERARLALRAGVAQLRRQQHAHGLAAFVRSRCDLLRDVARASPYAAAWLHGQVPVYEATQLNRTERARVPALPLGGETTRAFLRHSVWPHLAHDAEHDPLAPAPHMFARVSAATAAALVLDLGSYDHLERDEQYLRVLASLLWRGRHATRAELSENGMMQLFENAFDRTYLATLFGARAALFDFYAGGGGGDK